MVIFYMHANQSSLKMLDSVYHAALRFVTNSSFRTHHFSLYGSVGWLCVHNRGLEHWYIFLFKAILFTLPPYLCSLMTIETQRLVMSMRSRLQTVIDCKGFATKYGFKSESLIYDYYSVPLLLVP